MLCQNKYCQLFSVLCMWSNVTAKKKYDLNGTSATWYFIPHVATCLEKLILQQKEMPHLYQFNYTSKAVRKPHLKLLERGTSSVNSGFNCKINTQMPQLFKVFSLLRKKIQKFISFPKRVITRNGKNEKDQPELVSLSRDNYDDCIPLCCGNPQYRIIGNAINYKADCYKWLEGLVSIHFRFANLEYFYSIQISLWFINIYPNVNFEVLNPKYEGVRS